MDFITQSGSSSFAKPFKTDLLVGGKDLTYLITLESFGVPIKTQNFKLCFKFILLLFVVDSLIQNSSWCSICEG